MTDSSGSSPPAAGPHRDHLVEEFRKYLERFDQEIGPKDFGQFGTWQRKLIKKLKFEEFTVKYKRYREMAHVYEGIMKRGDTVNDAMLMTLRDHAAELLIIVDGNLS